MKYQIIVEKANDNRFLAYCPMVKNLRANGISVSAAVENLRNKIICYIHDDAMELEIVVDGCVSRGPDYMSTDVPGNS